MAIQLRHPPYTIDQLICNTPNLVCYLDTKRRTHMSELWPNTSLLRSTHVTKIGLPSIWLCRSCSPEFTVSEFRPRLPDLPRSVHVYILRASRQFCETRRIMEKINATNTAGQNASYALSHLYGSQELHHILGVPGLFLTERPETILYVCH